MNCTESMSCFSAKSAVASMVSRSSSSEPTTNMPWIRISWAWKRSIDRSILATSCFFWKSLSVQPRHRAESAGEGTAAGGGDGDDPARLPAGDEPVIGDRIHVQVGDLGALGVVHRPAVHPVREILDLLEPLAARSPTWT